MNCLPRVMTLASGLTLLCACATTTVHSQREAAVLDSQRPNHILVYDLATTRADITPNTSMTSHARAKAEKTTTAQRATKVARESTDAFSNDLVERLRALGFDARRAARGTPASGNDLVIDGEFVTINEGNRLRRIVIGFGSGKSAVDAQVHVYQGPGRRKLADFTTHSDSGQMPGAAVTMAAGAAVTGGVAPAALAAGAALDSIKAHRSATAKMAGRSGEQAADYLSELFVKEGWIPKEQAKHAKRA